MIEVEIPDREPELYRVIYTPLQSVFSEEIHTQEDMRHIFNGKTEEWQYEQEYRLIMERKYFDLEKPISRILLGPAISADHLRIFKKLFGSQIDLIEMKLGERFGIPAITSSTADVSPSPTPERFQRPWEKN